MKLYLDLVKRILKEGTFKGDRTGTGTISLFGPQVEYDLTKGFPLMTTKKMFTKGIIYELLWFLQGRTNNQWLNEQGVRIWDEWATPEQCARFGREPGDLGPIYGHQWRNFGATWNEKTKTYNPDGLDQISWLMAEIKKNPNSRRLIITGWNPNEQDSVALPPCHTLFQFFINDGKLSCKLHQRSADMFLGVPFNIASYALLTHMVAHVAGYGVGSFIHSFGDAHIYTNHLEQFKLQLSREPKPLPQLNIKRAVNSIFDFTYDDFEFVGYEAHPAIKAPVAV